MLLGQVRDIADRVDGRRVLPLVDVNFGESVTSRVVARIEIEEYVATKNDEEVISFA